MTVDTEINALPLADLLELDLPPHLKAAVAKRQRQAEEEPGKTISAFGSSVR